MHVIYDVSHNIAKVEEHMVDGKQRTLLVHRKGSTRAFPPHHPLIPVDYQVRPPQAVSLFHEDLSADSWFVVVFQLTGQPVLIGGTMGTCSYVLTGTEQGMTETFGTTCHGAVRVFISLHDVHHLHKTAVLMPRCYVSGVQNKPELHNVADVLVSETENQKT